MLISLSLAMGITQHFQLTQEEKSKLDYTDELTHFFSLSLTCTTRHTPHCTFTPVCLTNLLNCN